MSESPPRDGREIREFLLSLLSDPRSEPSAPSRICQACPELLAVSGGAISIRGDGGVPATVCASDQIAQRVEELQLSTGEGPCVTAVSERRPVLVTDLAAGARARWPGFCPDALAAGARALFAFPMWMGGMQLGVLDLYRSSPGGLSPTQHSHALLVADAAAVALVNQQEARPASDLDEDWWDPASFYRVEVHQATGMVMAQLGVSSTEALARLRGYAFAEERTLSEVARDVVSRVVRFNEGRTPPAEEGPAEEAL